MRFSMIFAIAVTVASAAPALAQNNTADTNATQVAAENTTTTTNVVETTATPAAPATTAAPADNAGENESVTVMGKRPFPWGVLGLVGLIGLLGRRRAR